MALQKSLETDRLPIGIFYEINKPTYHEQVLPASPTTLAEADISHINLPS